MINKKVEYCSLEDLTNPVTCEYATLSKIEDYKKYRPEKYFSPTDLIIKNCIIKHLPKDSLFGGVLEIKLENCIIINNNLLEELVDFPRLSKLEINNCLGNINLPEILEKLKGLEYLIIKNTEIDMINCDLTKLINLFILELVNNNFSIMSKLNFTSPRLDELNITSNSLNEITFALDMNIAKITINDCAISNIQDDILLLKNAKCIDLMGNRITDLSNICIENLNRYVAFYYMRNPIRKINKKLLSCKFINYEDMFFFDGVENRSMINCLIKTFRKAKQDVSLGINTNENKVIIDNVGNMLKPISI